MRSQLTAVFFTFQLYYHGDPIPVKVKVNNETSKVIKKIKITSTFKLFMLHYKTTKQLKICSCVNTIKILKYYTTLHKGNK